MKDNLISNNLNLMKEWYWEKNNSLNLFPDKLTCGCSRKNVWWKCNVCQHEWCATPNNRSRGTGCPVCSNKIIMQGINDLATLYPEVAKGWHPTLNKLKPTQVAPKSNQKVYWLCEKNSTHFFATRIDHMVDSNIQCPICANQKVLQGFNDLATTHPELMKEWDYEKNRDIFPNEITYGKTIKVWWKCKNGHSWQSTVASRAGSQKVGCPICKKELFISFPEKCISFYLSKTFVIEENKKFDWLGMSELDIFIPQLNLAIEYDGETWHTDYNRDLKKDELCKKKGIQLIRVREKKCPNYNSSAIKIVTNAKDYKNLNMVIDSIFNYINCNYSQNVNIDVDIDRDYYEILSNISNIVKNKSIANSPLIKEWNYNKNGEVLPETISLGSEKKVWWICEKGHEWQAVVYSRSGKGRCGCPYCAGQKVVSGWNDLQTLYPDIIKEWDYEKNELSPLQIRPQTNKKYWWKCIKCNHLWQAAPSDRVRGTNCPKCAREITISSHFKQVRCIETDEIFNSIKMASEKYDINRTSISNCCLGKTKTAGGYHWEYVDKKD